MSTSSEFLDGLITKLKTFDKKGAEIICTELIQYLLSSESPLDADDAENILQQLRNKRLFVLMQEVADAFIQTQRHSSKICRLYAQALIDQNNFTAAICVLEQLITQTSEKGLEKEVREEYHEAKGLVGRAYKQLYVKANNGTISRNTEFIQQSIKFYLDVYESEPEKYTWHGINVVALVHRCKKDGIETTGFSDIKNMESLASSILQTIEKKNAKELAEPWDFATAGEACIALNRPEEALEWFSGYARMPYCNAFQLASTLRQLEEVWRLNMGSESGRLILPLLRAELLKREGGSIVIKVDELQREKSDVKHTKSTYKSLVKERSTKNKVTLEKVFDNGSFNSYRWYKTGAERCLAVARIGTDVTTGIGTGFLLKGFALHESLGEELFVITNAHVVSDDPKENNALKGEEAKICFEALNADEKFQVDEILWSSPRQELDATVIRFNEEQQTRLKELTKDVKIYPVSEYLPIINYASLSNRVYIIGHPLGGELQLSLQDNILLDHQNPKIHYRTPTDAGSSGSPVFNDKWYLIGLHHAGSMEMNCLNGRPGTYNSNEGIWIQAIKDKINEQLNSRKECKEGFIKPIQ